MRLRLFRSSPEISHTPIISSVQPISVRGAGFGISARLVLQSVQPAAGDFIAQASSDLGEVPGRWRTDAAHSGSETPGEAEFGYGCFMLGVVGRPNCAAAGTFPPI